MNAFRKFMAIVLLIFSIACASRQAQQSGVPDYMPEDKALHDTIVQVDSLLFNAYNTCKLEIFEQMVSEDVEFYHDRGGLTTSKKQLVEALKNNICGKVTRELLKGSIEVYRIPGYGAIEMGAHRFFNNQEKESGPSRFSKFVHTWKWENDRWQLARVISLH
jgi:hypothetical protein